MLNKQNVHYLDKLLRYERSETLRDVRLQKNNQLQRDNNNSASQAGIFKEFLCLGVYKSSMKNVPSVSVF